MGMKRSLTTAHHPQADGQTEIVNQYLEIAIRAYIGPSRDDWSELLDPLALSYNTSPHTSSGFSPAYLLRGYQPITSAALLSDQSPDIIPRPTRDISVRRGDKGEIAISDEAAQAMVDGFEEARSRAKDALLLAQVAQRKDYDHERTLELLRKEKGRGKKLLMKYDGPFEIIRKLSPVSYQLRLPDSYGLHPILNIAHLERYRKSPPEFGERPKKPLNRRDFEVAETVEVERIIDEKWGRKRQGRRHRIYKSSQMHPGSYRNGKRAELAS